MKNNKDQRQEFLTILQQNNLTPEQRRRFFLAILSDENHGVLRLTKPGSLQHTAVSNVIALLNDNCKDMNEWKCSEAAARAAADATAEDECAADAAAEDEWAAAMEEHYSWMAHTLSKLIQEAA